MERYEQIIADNEERTKKKHSRFNPITGEGAVLPRVHVHIKDFYIKDQYLPEEMMNVKMVADIAKLGSIKKYAWRNFRKYEHAEEVVRMQLLRLRYRYDFCFWAATVAFIKAKGGGEDIRFVLNAPQRKLLEQLEKLRIAHLPIRIIMLKARQWGGSTLVQIYYSWLQLIHYHGINSLIVAHVKDTSNEILDMFDRLLRNYPEDLLYDIGQAYVPGDTRWQIVGNSINTHRIPQRNCKVKIGSAERPDSARGGDYNLVHCSEVGIWKKTSGKTPEDIVRSACSGILLTEGTAIIYESTANGVGNFFHQEYVAAKRGDSQFQAFFVAWYEIERYEIPFGSESEKKEFAKSLYDNRNNEYTDSDRREPGRYLWYLWQSGATLESIHWYTLERRKYSDHGKMASEYPSDDNEAFVNSGSRVFDNILCERLRTSCRPPMFVGDVIGDADDGEEALENVRFTEDRQGMLAVWDKPDVSESEIVTDRYLVVVDIGGRTAKADWSVIVVFDRIYLMDGDKPAVVAQWYGHIDIDKLAWKAAQIATYYDDAKLVIESNTIETHDKERHIEGGDQSMFILNQIKSVYSNLYARRQTDQQIKDQVPRMYGFHTNVSTKPMVISFLIKVVREGMYVERDTRCIDELINYERKPSGAYGAISGEHDDLLMTRAIGMHICFNEMDTPSIIPASRGVKRNSHSGDVSEAVM